MPILNKYLLKSTDGIVKTFNLPDITKSVIPAMTSTILPSGKVTSSSVQGGNYDWMAFDGVTTNNGWLSVGVTNQWLSYEFPVIKVINRYTINCTYAVQNAPKDWVFQGSNDNGVNWDTLDIQSNITSWVLNTKKTFIFKNVKPYKIYRLFCYAINGGANYTTIGEMEMFEDFGDVTITPNTSPSENDFINFGMDTLSINPVKINKKKYITSNKQPLGGGNTYEKVLNLTNGDIKSLIL